MLYKNKIYATISASVNLKTDIIASFVLAVMASSSSAAVFEQLQDGTISENGGVSLGMLPVVPSVDIPDVNIPAEDKTVSFSNSAVILDDPAGSRAQNAVSTVPAHSATNPPFSSDQRRMRLLAAEIALSHSDRPGVRLARLDQATFVTLFTAMIGRESNFNPRAVSPVGAKGLGQLMPQTALELGVCDVFSPRENLEGAAVYLTTMLEQFGSPSLALAAYNAGPGAVTRYKGIPPYPETRKYVADIVQTVSQTPRTVPSAPPIDAFASTFDTAIRGDTLAASLTDQSTSSHLRSNCRTKVREGTTVAEN